MASEIWQNSILSYIREVVTRYSAKLQPAKKYDDLATLEISFDWGSINITLNKTTLIYGYRARPNCGSKYESSTWEIPVQSLVPPVKHYICNEIVLPGIAIQSLISALKPKFASMSVEAKQIKT